ncbi:hypothetical protein AGMMS49942_01440 [Spirochaetia bacterium]|nr:hypothetical protein AGMMS49942_01440 [Spirochaetia bacterium]
MNFRERVLGNTPVIFTLYLLGSFLVLVIYRLIFPGEVVPLECFSLSWRLVMGVLGFIRLFPALAASSLVIPFGFNANGEEIFARFSPRFIEKIQGTILAAIIASAVYGLLFFIALPLAEEQQSDMRYKGELFNMARDRATIDASKSNWQEAFYYLTVCENIWPESPVMDQLRVRITIGIESVRYSGNSTETVIGGSNRPARSGSGAQRQAVRDAAEALNMAKTALSEERYYDAHWQATLASKLADPGSFEAQEAARIASDAWNKVSSLEPNNRATENYSLYHLKRQGYEAMAAAKASSKASDDWIRAYYIFRELSEKTPNDPDVAKFLSESKQGIAGLAFFRDELSAGIGETLTGAVFSIPLVPGFAPGGRVVMRAGSLISYPDYSYAIGLELAAFDGNNRPLYEVKAPYVKFIPMTVQGTPRLVILLRALDRNDRNIHWEPVWEGPGRSDLGEAQIALDTTYENFLRLSKARRQVGSLFFTDLLAMSRDFGNYGYIPQVFQAEIIRRIAEPVMLLPMTILAIVIGWRFRAKKAPRYLGFPMLLIIPLVFNGVTHLIRSLTGVLGLWLLLSLGFSSAIAMFVAGSVLFFILSLIILASQRGE